MADHENQEYTGTLASALFGESSGGALNTEMVSEETLNEIREMMNEMYEDEPVEEIVPTMEKKEKPDNTGRFRLLYLFQMLTRKTDAEHPLTTNQLINLLKKEHGIDVNRNTISKDLKSLNESGLHVEVKRSTQNQYYYDGQMFEIPELKVLIDAVSSAKFITERESGDLIRKLIRLANDYGAEKLCRHVSVEGRVKSGNEKGYYIVDAINDAIDTKKRISFRYIDYDAEKNPVFANGGKPYTFSPYSLVWDGDYYYVVGYCETRQAAHTFRLDRIAAQPDILEEAQTPMPDDFSVANHSRSVFRMYSGEDTVEVSLVCRNKRMKYVIDKFGKDVRTDIVDSEHFRAVVSVSPSPTFYRWIFGWNGDMRIQGPEEVRNAYREMARKALED